MLLDGLGSINIELLAELPAHVQSQVEVCANFLALLQSFQTE